MVFDGCEVGVWLDYYDVLDVEVVFGFGLEVEE